MSRAAAGQARRAAQQAAPEVRNGKRLEMIGQTMRAFRSREELLAPEVEEEFSWLRSRFHYEHIFRTQVPLFRDAARNPSTATGNRIERLGKFQIPDRYTVTNLRNIEFSLLVRQFTMLVCRSRSLDVVSITFACELLSLAVEEVEELTPGALASISFMGAAVVTLAAHSTGVRQEHLVQVHDAAAELVRLTTKRLLKEREAFANSLSVQCGAQLLTAMAYLQISHAEARQLLYTAMLSSGALLGAGLSAALTLLKFHQLTDDVPEEVFRSVMSMHDLWTDDALAAVGIHFLYLCVVCNVDVPNDLLRRLRKNIASFLHIPAESRNAHLGKMRLLSKMATIMHQLNMTDRTIAAQMAALAALDRDHATMAFVFVVLSDLQLSIDLRPLLRAISPRELDAGIMVHVVHACASDTVCKKEYPAFLAQLKEVGFGCFDSKQLCRLLVAFGKLGGRAQLDAEMTAVEAMLAAQAGHLDGSCWADLVAATKMFAFGPELQEALATLPLDDLPVPHLISYLQVLDALSATTAADKGARFEEAVATCARQLDACTATDAIELLAACRRADYTPLPQRTDELMRFLRPVVEGLSLASRLSLLMSVAHCRSGSRAEESLLARLVAHMHEAAGSLSPPQKSDVVAALKKLGTGEALRMRLEQAALQ
ncbi:hypothetical protein DIPPA_02175 [Diplonema papillatum]|nr:hypothetical protein DIPPA_02175 [Diplonema papillatum]